MPSTRLQCFKWIVQSFERLGDAIISSRVEKRNKRARILVALQVWKKWWREFRRSCKQNEWKTLYAFPIFSVSSNIFTSLIESCFIIWPAPRAGNLACSGLPVASRKRNFLESFIINPLLAKLVRSRWLDIGLVLFLRVYGPRLRLGP